MIVIVPITVGLAVIVVMIVTVGWFTDRSFVILMSRDLIVMMSRIARLIGANGRRDGRQIPQRFHGL